MKRLFVINPQAGRRGFRRGLDRLKSDFESAGDFTYVVPKNREDTIAETRAALRRGIEQIVVVGGDGTLNAVVNGFFENGRPIEPQACLAVTRAGTGSDYYRSIGGRRGWRELVMECVPRAVDVGRIEFPHQRQPPHYFINITSIGLSGAVAQDKNRGPRWIPSSLSYLLPSLRQVLTFRDFPARLTLDSETFTGQVLDVFIAKGIYAGGGMRLGGAVALDDGKFDVTVVERMGLLGKLGALARTFRGFPRPEKHIRKARVARLRLETEVEVPVQFDGEVLKCRGLEVSLQPRCLRVCFPRTK
jgi:YegS/Rv2252/BmrU family lipid kinase